MRRKRINLRAQRWKRGTEYRRSCTFSEHPEHSLINPPIPSIVPPSFPDCGSRERRLYRSFALPPLPRARMNRDINDATLTGFPRSLGKYGGWNLRRIWISASSAASSRTRSSNKARLYQLACVPECERGEYARERGRTHARAYIRARVWLCRKRTHSRPRLQLETCRIVEAQRR